MAIKVNKLVEKGVIGIFTITRPLLKRHLFTVFMTRTHYKSFVAAMIANSQVETFHKISGKDCYHLTMSEVQLFALVPSLNP